MFFEDIYKTIRKYDLIEPGCGIIIGVSGGADSVCLLSALAELRDNLSEYAGLRLYAVHVHHGIRGAEADRDADFTEKLALSAGVPERTVRIDVPAISVETGYSEEETGRRERYRIFEEIRRELDFDLIAVAHNSDDLCETFLLNLARGTGLSGLSGIKPKNGRIIRPLIDTDRKRIEEMLEGACIGHITDSTNLSDDYTRNRIRHIILPAIRDGVNEKAAEHIAEAARRIGDAGEFIKKEASKAEKRYVTETDGSFLISNEATELDNVVLTELIHDLLARLAGRMRDIAAIHINNTAGLLTGHTGRHLDLIYGITADRTYDGVILAVGDAGRISGQTVNNDRQKPSIITEIFEVPSVRSVQMTADGLHIVFDDGKIMNLPENSCTKWFDYGKIFADTGNTSVSVRFRQPGDYIIIDTSGRRCRLKEYFIDEKIPSAERGSIALLAAGSNILWIPGHRTGEGAHIDCGTRKIMKAVINGSS